MINRIVFVLDFITDDDVLPILGQHSGGSIVGIHPGGSIVGIHSGAGLGGGGSIVGITPGEFFLILWRYSKLHTFNFLRSFPID